MSSRDVFHAPECDCPKCNYADGKDAERAAVVKYLRTVLGWEKAVIDTIEKGEHHK
jgi:hypothetical protein